MLLFLMAQLHSFSRLALVLSIVPMGLIGIVTALLIFGRPLGFVAILGILALMGMIARDAVILIEQIETERAEGRQTWDAVIANSARFRPIMLTAISTVLGFLPIAPTVFWGPMAFAIMGGLFVATMLTLIVLPALYVAWPASRSLWPKAPLLVDKLKCSPHHAGNKIHRERPVKFLGVFFLGAAIVFAPCAASAASHHSHHALQTSSIHAPWDLGLASPPPHHHHHHHHTTEAIVSVIMAPIRGVLKGRVAIKASRCKAHSLFVTTLARRRFPRDGSIFNVSGVEGFQS